MLFVIAWSQLVLTARLVRASGPVTLNNVANLIGSITDHALIGQQDNESLISGLTGSHSSASLSDHLATTNRIRKLLQYEPRFDEASTDSPQMYLDSIDTTPHQLANSVDLSPSASLSFSPYIEPNLRPSTVSPEDAIPSLSDISNGELVFRLLGAIFCVLIILCTIVGNVLVIIVVTRFHRMRTVTNILLASLALADITVACLVMPFTVVYDVFRYWPWGSIPCHFWISCDVMCCTASILHLCCVAIDRFWAITRPLRYRTYISKRRLFCCIVVIWVCSAAISFIPIFSGYYHSDGPINVFTLKYSAECGLDVNRIYATISSLTSFYLPLPIMFYVYFRILLVAERQSREIKALEQSLAQNGLLSVHYTPVSPTPHTSNGKSQPHAIHFSSLINVETGETGHLNGAHSIDAVSLGGSSDHSSMENKRHVERSLRRRTRQLITDTKAIRTLGIVMGVFCLCWLPFFIMYVISAYCVNCNISYEFKSGITWLGYINSALNPAIYAYLNKEFKTAFKRVICCMPRMQMEPNDRDAMLDEISTTSRSCQRGNMDRVHGGLDVPPTPGFMSRTPSATPDTTNWPIIHAHNLMLSTDRSSDSRNASISITNTNGNTEEIVIPVKLNANGNKGNKGKGRNNRRHQ